MLNQLPPARLIPKDGADRTAILKGQARDGARVAGRVAWGAGKALGLIALCGVGLVAIGAGTGRTKSRALDDLDRRMESIRRMNESLRTIQVMPKIDYSRLLDYPHEPSHEARLRLADDLGFEHELSPAQQAKSSP